MQDIRNIAIIAHVDHGKTTLVDKMMLAGHLFRNDQTNGELVLDNNDLERERGITILSKNVSINYKGTKINIIDTPGHADFGGEVERVLNMADGCILLVDAFEGPMPQTRFVLQKALQIGLKPVVVVNKVDKPNCRPEEVYEMVFDLMFSLNATEDQLDFPVIYGSAKNNWMSTDWKTPTENLVPLLDAIIEHIPAPKQLEGTPQMLITSLDYSAYTGRIAVGRVHRGTLKEGMNITLAKRDGSLIKSKIKELHTFEGLGRKKTNAVSSGDICAVVGVEGFEIGDTICDFENPEPLPPIAIDEPTMSMLFTINDSPFFGKEGKFVTSRHIQDRLTKELDTEFKPGARIGVGMEYQFNDMISLQPSLFFSQKGAKYSSGFDGNIIDADADVKINQLYLELPVNVQFRFNIADNTNLVIATGPYLACGVGGKAKFDGDASVGGIHINGDDKIDTFGDDGLDYNRFDAGWNIGLGVEFGKILVGLDTQLGFCKVMDGDAPHNANIGITLGYKF